ncbi:MAG: L,D-transpeptidase family protein [Nitritalea sp.]
MKPHLLRHPIRAILCALLLSLGLAGTAQLQAQATEETLAFELTQLLDLGSDGNFFGPDRARLYSIGQVKQLYADRQFQPLWTDSTGMNCLGYELAYELRQLRYDGLMPEDYHGDLIRDWQRRYRHDSPSMTAIAYVELLLTDALMGAMTHLYYGKVDPESLRADYDIRRKSRQIEVLEKVLQIVETKKIRSNLAALSPGFSSYPRMRRQMKQLDQLRYGADTLRWSRLQVSRGIRPNETHALLPDVRQRMLLFGDLTKEEFLISREAGTTYDSTLLLGVRRLQQRLGLNQDGILGNGTLAGINEAPEQQMQKLAVNMERLRWLPDTLKEETVVVVNIANFRMDLIQNRDTLFSTEAIVGKNYRKTPVFNAEMSYLVFSPTWTVPPTILANDVLPAVKKDINYLKSKQMRVLTFDGKEVNPTTINWQSITARGFPYMIRQDPGPQNSLGAVKFMFPNRYNVYIHDTPSREQFGRDNRALSSGCIRIREPERLAAILLEEQGWTPERIAASMKRKTEENVRLKRPIPVVLLYLTAWTDEGGRLQWREDIYTRDAELAAALRSKRTAAGGSS